MKLLSRAVSIIILILLFGFSLKNMQEVSLQFFLGYELTAPLIIMLLAFFCLGALAAILALVPMIFRHKRDISRHKKTIAEIEKERQAEQRAAMEPPPPDGVRNT
jgi:uncharacterized integral membrane protein